MQITPPKYVKAVLKELEIAGFSAFLVGGCVRDMLLEKRPNDWDICTNALPEQIMQIFPMTVETGLKHGTVTVLMGKHRVEVTTFRSESDYADHRHPNNVRFIASLTGDLERRDFTMNAIAVPLDGLIYDPFNGTDDISHRLIRCVGDPEKRFEEDALRMFRALRFSAKLGFDIEASTDAAIYKKAYLASALAPERVKDELEKILLSPSPSILSRVLSYRLLDEYLDRPGASCDLRRLRYLTKNRQQRWSALCAALEQKKIIDTASFLSRLRLDNATIRNCSTAVDIAIHDPPADRLAWKRVLAKFGVESAQCAAAALDMLQPGSNVKQLRSIIGSGECFSLKRLAVNGDDLRELGLEGNEIGATLNMLLDYVLENPGKNIKYSLINLVIICRKY